MSRKGEEDWLITAKPRVVVKEMISHAASERRLERSKGGDSEKRGAKYIQERAKKRKNPIG